MIDDLAADVPYRAAKALSITKTFFTWALGRNKIKFSPAAGVPAPIEPPVRNYVLTDDEIRWFWLACEKVGYPFGHMAQLLLLTATRLREMAWSVSDEFRSEGSLNLFVIPAVRVKNNRTHRLPCSSIAMQVVQALPIIESEKGFLFTTNGKTPISGFSKAIKAIKKNMREIAVAEAQERGEDPGSVEIGDWRFHDLRRTASTNMAKLQILPHIIERVLNHVSGEISGVAAIYNRFHFEEQMAEALQKYASYIQALAAGQIARNVVPLRRKTGG